MKRCFFCCLLLTVSFLAVDSNADVLIKSKTTMDQLLGIGNSESTTSTYIKGDKNRTDTETTFNSPIFKLSNEDMNSKTSEIYRLDKDVLWNLDPKDKSYSEVFIKSLKPGNKGGQPGNEPSSPSTGQDIEDYDWTVKVDISDKPEDVNGFESTKGVMKAVGVKKGDNSDSMFFDLTVWKCPDTKVFGDIENYQEKFAEVAGFEEESGFGAAGGYAAGFGTEFESEGKKLEEMKGYPVKTSLLIQKSNSDSDNMNQPGISDMMKGLMGGKKGGDKGDEASSGRITVISVTDEVVSVDNSAIDDAMFEIPDGYIKR